MNKTIKRSVNQAGANMGKRRRIALRMVSVSRVFRAGITSAGLQLFSQYNTHRYAGRRETTTEVMSLDLTFRLKSGFAKV
jgi:hypothetical protein